MAAIAHSPSFAKKVGVSQSVGKDFNAADKGKTFNKGGMMKTRKFAEAGSVDDSDMDDEGNTKSKYEIDPDSRRAHGLYDKVPTPKATSKDTPKATPKAVSKVTPQRAAPQTFESMASKARDAGNSSGDKPYKYTPKVVDYGDEGDRLRARKGDFEDQFKGIGRAGRLYRRDAEAGIKPYKKGGMMKESKAMVGKEVAFMKKKGDPASMVKHEKAEMMGMKKGGGIESRGKTKGTIIRMAMGGSVSSASRRADGIAQRGKTKC
jgi:hypothetical protein